MVYLIHLQKPLFPIKLVTVTPNDWKGISDINGNYIVSLDTSINNTWRCNTTNKYATIVPDSYSATPTSLDLLPNDHNFGIRYKPNIKDLEAHLAGTAVRPGFKTNIGVTANNIGTINQSNITVKLKKPAGYNVLATSTAPTSTLNDTLFWKNVSIDFLNKMSFYVELQVPVSEVLGTEIVYEAWVNGTQGDTTPIDNYAKWTETVRGSFDPNDKLVSKTTLPPAYDVEKDRLSYTIRFQNTGTDTAFYVRVKDEMPANLNLSTLRVINASHAYQLIVREKNIVEFAFPNILLPDKTTNEPKSHGFVQFSIQPKAGLPVNTKIENNAAIYFDYNAPIITNFATTEVKLTTGLANNKNLDFKLYPNPTNGTVRIELPYSGDGNWILSDISGRQIKTNYFANGEKVMELNLSDLPLGTYFITIQLGGNVSTAKIIKM
ncbi:MAG: T9SS type A sorting domain-containing protein [Bacteroidetes bacterium]|nr:T9SS type A sorting domain-containing protein [Bacteroidota bacterium]